VEVESKKVEVEKELYYFHLYKLNNMPIERFEDVKAWQKAKVLTIQIYKLFEQSKDFGFKDQIHRWSKFVTSIL